jgi:voltage-gated sodium channel
MSMKQQIEQLGGSGGGGMTTGPKVVPPELKVKVMERSTEGGFRKTDPNLGASGAPKAEPMAALVDDAATAPVSDKTKAAEAARAAMIPLVDQLWFNVFVSVMTFINAFIIGLEQELSDSAGGIGDRTIWWLIELTFASIFTVEIILRVMCLKIKFFTDIWNLCDTVIVSAAIVDALVLQPANMGGKARLLTTLRTMRVIQLVRLVRMFKTFRELWLLVGGLVNSIKALTWICIILLLLNYVCAVVATTEIGQNVEIYGNGPSYDGLVWPYQEYFGTVFKSMFTLFQVMTLDGWCDDVVRHILYFQPMFAMLFIFFLVITAFGLMNVVIGVIVENTLSAATVADQAIAADEGTKRKKALDQLQVMLELSDSDRSGSISLQELEAAAQSRVVQAQLEALDVRTAEVEQLFELLDYERKGSVDLKKFINSCRELVGGARRRDIAQVEITVGTLTQRLDSLDRKFTHIETEVAALGNLTEDFLQNTVRLLTGFDGTIEPESP